MASASLAVQRHQSAVAQRDGAFLLARVFLFADGEKLSSVHHQPPIAGRIGGAKSEHRDRGAVRERAAQLGQGVRRDQRRVREDHQKIVEAARNRVLRREHRMRGSAPLALHRDLRIRDDPLGFLRDRIVIGTDDDDGRAGRRFAHRIEHMREQGAARRLVQHLGQRGAHAGSLARGKHDGQTGAGFVHSLASLPVAAPAPS